MKLSKLVILITIVGAFIFNSCKDDDDKLPDPSTNKTNTEKLVAKNWKLTAAVFNPPLVITLGVKDSAFTNLFDIPLIQACQKDNMFMFNNDTSRTMTIDNGPLKCGTEPQTAKDGNWKFLNNETQIEITNSAYFSLINASGVIIDKLVLNETEMKGQTDYEFVNPLTQQKTKTKIDFTFTKM
ncbi:MAG: hypothetical protein ACKVQB_12090 [Bacteroidia bacterium]